MEAIKASDWMGTQQSDLINFLNYPDAKQYLKKGITKAKWDKLKDKNTRRAILAQMRKYMSFAWDKANNCRGLSADRSINHYRAWIWMLNDGFLKKLEMIEYEHYGKEKLIAICKQYGWEWKKLDNGERTNYG